LADPYFPTLVYWILLFEKDFVKNFSDLLIGAHTSAQGGAFNALLQGQEIGATTIQLFTANQKTWHTKPISEEDVAKWEEALAMTGMKKVMSHDSYLINLGCPHAENLHKSRHAFERELLRCHQLRLDFLNFHPGAALDGTEEQCLETIVKSLLEFEKLAAKGPTRLLIESTAGQGSSVGDRFEHLGYLVEALHHKIPIGVCLDTCHLFAAGYDISSMEGWKAVLKEFDQVVGIKHLYALHVNDSAKPLGSHVDRHASLGAGEIGIDCFKAMMHHPDLRKLPKYLETPDPDIWPKEIAKLREFAI
jgi:deoxyribonuclease IV